MQQLSEALTSLASPLRIVLGAEGISEPGWIPTEEFFFNVLKLEDWERFFSTNSIDAILAEHVWEHLTIEEGITAAQLCFQYLKPGGYLRVAVPDGLHPDPGYGEWVRPGGTGPGADEHKVLFTYKTLQEQFERAGFRVEMLEYFDEQGEFFQRDWAIEDGIIRRSRKLDSRNRNGNANYTSIILDARKPRTDRPPVSPSEILRPFSTNWGFERGGPIDRYYINAFVRLALQGRYGVFLEFGRPTYRRFIEPGDIERYEILDIAADNPEATVVGDIETLASIPDNTFDVIICTQVLQLVKHPDVAIERMRRLIKPSGLLVISVPFVSRACDATSDRWRFSQIAVEQLLAGFSNKEIKIAGNLFSSICFLLGLGMNDVNQRDLDQVDPQHYTVVLATATK